MKLSKDTIYTLWSIAIVAMVILCLFSLIFSACAKPSDGSDTGGFQVEPASETPGIKPAQGEEQENEADTGNGEGSEAPVEAQATETSAASVRLSQTADAGRSYLDRIIFLGDSTTYGIGYYYDQGYSELCPSSQVWTPASGTRTLSYHSIATIVYPDTGEELSIIDAVSNKHPDILLVTLGVNGISFMDEDWFISDYTTLVRNIQQASPETKIILNSIYPVAASYKYQSDINNDKIRAANGWIERVAADTGCRYLHSYEAVVGSDGNLPESSQNGDGLHLTGEAFTKVMEYIRTHAWE